jgi:uncharacterized membrane protein
VSLDLAVLVFPRIEAAEHAYADVIEAVGDAPWTHEIAFVEHHRHDRIVVRGTFAGRYVDVDDEADVIGKRTAEGALTGAVVGAFFGPPGFAVGIVAGGAVGGLTEAGHIPALHSTFFDEVRADVPEKSSAIVLLAAPEHVDAMVAGFADHGGRLARRSLSPTAARALEAAVAGSPPAAPAPQPDGE